MRDHKTSDTAEILIHLGVQLLLVSVRVFFNGLAYAAKVFLKGDEEEETLLDRCPFNGCKHSSDAVDCSVRKR